MSIPVKANPTVLITGASSGIGRELAQQSAEEEYFVFSGYRNTPITPADLNGSTEIPVKLDVCDAGSIQTAIDTVVKTTGSLDILICNAGQMIEGMFECAPIDDFQAVMDVNFFGVVRTIQAVLPVMRAAGGGRIIVVSSLSGILGMPETAAYTASKHAVEGACESLAIEVARFGIELCLAQPGAFKTSIGEQPRERSPYDIKVYRPLIKHLSDHRAAMGGEDPSLAAKEILSLFDLNPLPFRIPIGDQARFVIDHINKLEEDERRSFIYDATKTQWWLEGKGSH